MQIILMARRFSEFKVYKQFLTSTYRSGEWQESKYSNLAGTLFVEVQVPSRQPGILKSRVRISRGLEQCTHQSMPKRYETPQFWSRVFAAGVKLRATASADDRWTIFRYKAAPNPKLISIGCSQQFKSTKMDIKNRENEFVFPSGRAKFCKKDSCYPPLCTKREATSGNNFNNMSSEEGEARDPSPDLEAGPDFMSIMWDYTYIYISESCCSNDET